MSETGHAKNLEHFQQMIAFVTSWGSSYKPTNDQIKLTSLSDKLDLCTTAMTNVTAARTGWKGAVNERESVFEGVRPLVTRCVQYYESTETASNNVDDVRSLKRKLDGVRAKTKDVPPPEPPGDGTPGGGDGGTGEGGTGTGTVSASQQSYVQIVEHLSGIISLFNQDPHYAPNESDLTVASLEARRNAMAGANTGVIDAYVPFSAGIGERKQLMYAPDTGLIELAKKVKKYVRGAYGADSIEFKQISGLQFVPR